jgi:hypothetical protein
MVWCAHSGMAAYRGRCARKSVCCKRSIYWTKYLFFRQKYFFIGNYAMIKNDTFDKADMGTEFDSKSMSAQNNAPAQKLLSDLELDEDYCGFGHAHPSLNGQRLLQDFTGSVADQITLTPVGTDGGLDLIE